MSLGDMQQRRKCCRALVNELLHQRLRAQHDTARALLVHHLYVTAWASTNTSWNHAGADAYQATCADTV